MERLDDRSRTILQRRWMSEDKATLHELADEYGVSAERIRQIEAGAHDPAAGCAARTCCVIDATRLEYNKSGLQCRAPSHV